MGADDGASGVGVLMSLAKTIGESALEIGVDIVFFDIEDHGSDTPGQTETWALGSAYWSRNVDNKYKPKHAFLLDMVGARDATFGKDPFSMQQNPILVNKTWKLAQDMGYGNYFLNEDFGGIMDDHIRVNEIAKIPMIDIVHKTRSKEFGHYHHTHKDDIDIIDKRTMKAVGQVMTAVVFNTQNGKF